MRLPLYFVSIVLVTVLFKYIKTEVVSSREERTILLIEAGCKVKMWKKTWNHTEQIIPYWNYVWVASGNLLAKGACVNYEYRRYLVPEKGITKVYSTIEEQKVRSVDVMKETVSIDYTLTLRWMDPGIKTNLSQTDKQSGGIVFDKDNMGLIWTPDLYIYNLSTFTSNVDATQVKSLKILTTNEFNQEYTKTNNVKQDTRTVIELKLEVKSTVYCKFDFSAYPMDKQTCQPRFGSASLGATFILYDPNQIFHNSINYQAANLDITVIFFDGNVNSGHNVVGLNIQMTRFVKPFVMKYYLPCITIVLVSQLSFIIPPSAIPGRVALLVTVFLTLTNLYIQQLHEGPSESDLNALGIYFLCSLFFVVGAIIEFSTLVLFKRLLTFQPKILPSEREFKDNRDTPKVIKKRGQLYEFTNTKIKKHSDVLEDTTYVQELKRNLRFCPQTINAIDFIAFWAFFIIYFLFNVTYWMHYSQA